MFRQVRYITTLIVLALSAPQTSAAALVDQDLLYAREAGAQCEIGVWRSSEARAIAFAESESCPEYLYWAPEAATVFFLDGDALRAAIAYQPGSARTVAPLPSLKFVDYSDRLRGRWTQDTLDMLAQANMEIALAGYTNDGAVFLHIRQWTLTDDSWHLRLAWRDGSWAVVEEGGCQKWDAKCHTDFAAVDEFGYDWLSDPRDVWTPGIRSNRYFVRDEYLGTDGNPSPAGPTKRTFTIDGKTTDMIVVASESGHFSTMYTFGVVLDFPDGNSLTICDRQCTAMLADRYLLARRYWGGTTELYDIADGSSVLGPLATALWIEAREYQARD